MKNDGSFQDISMILPEDLLLASAFLVFIPEQQSLWADSQIRPLITFVVSNVLIDQHLNS